MWLCRSAALKPGGEKPGTVASICATVSPFVKPFRNAWLLAAACAKRFPPLVSAGDTGRFDGVKRFSCGEFSEKKSTAEPVNASLKIPTPPRMTVLREAPNGCQAKPKRGCLRTESRLLSI